VFEEVRFELTGGSEYTSNTDIGKKETQLPYRRHEGIEGE